MQNYPSLDEAVVERIHALTVDIEATEKGTSPKGNGARV